MRALIENGGDLDAMDRDRATAKDYCCRGCYEYDCEDKCELIQGILIILILENVDILLSTVCI